VSGSHLYGGCNHLLHQICDAVPQQAKCVPLACILCLHNPHLQDCGVAKGRGWEWMRWVVGRGVSGT